MDLEPRDVEVQYHQITHDIGLNFSDDDRIESEPFSFAGTMQFKKNRFVGDWTEEFLTVYKNSNRYTRRRK